MDATPPTFSARCTELRAHIGRIQSSDADKHLVQTMERIREELADHLSRIVALTTTMQVFSSVEDIPRPVVDASAVKALKKTISTLTGKLDKNRSQIGNNNNWADCGVKAKGLADSLERDFRKIWSDYIATEQPGYAVFNAYRIFPQCRTILDELDRLAGALGELKKMLPQDPLTIFSVTKTATLMRAKIASLPLGGVPPEMADFLKKCAGEGGAHLSDLTPEIFKWIREQGFAGDLRVKPR
jgi:hypothetical protein